MGGSRNPSKSDSTKLDDYNIKNSDFAELVKQLIEESLKPVKEELETYKSIISEQKNIIRQQAALIDEFKSRYNLNSPNVVQLEQHKLNPVTTKKPYTRSAAKNEHAIPGSSSDNNDLPLDVANTVRSFASSVQVPQRVQRKQRRIIVGTKQVDGTATGTASTGLAAASAPSPRRSFSVHVYRLALNVSEDTLKAYLKQAHPSSKFQVEKLKSRGDWYTSFKIDVEDYNVYKVLLSPEFWPEGILAGKFVPSKNFLAIQTSQQ